MRRASHYRWTVLGLLLTAAVAAPAPAADAIAGGASTSPRWHPRGDGLRAQAAWQPAIGSGGVIMQCDRGDPRMVLRIDPDLLPSGLQQITLVADSIGVEYPVERTGEGGYVSKIALDAPILDRMLVARSFPLGGGGRRVKTGMPGAAVARVVRACREFHWPREARIDPSDAGLAKK